MLGPIDRIRPTPDMEAATVSPRTVAHSHVQIKSDMTSTPFTEGDASAVFSFKGTAGEIDPDLSYLIEVSLGIDRLYGVLHLNKRHAST